MALSCYANSCVEFDQLNCDMSCFAQPPTELPPPPPELSALDYGYSFSDSYLDPLLDAQELFCFDSYISLLPYFYENSCTLMPEIFPAAEYKFSYPEAKRLKVNQYDGFAPVLCNNGFVPNPCLLPGLSPEILGPFPDFTKTTPLVYGNRSNAEEGMRKPGSGASLSAQSIAARQRRRKITEKTQELGKLIPGGQKMNTAEMFQAAFKYIKFLQAQVAILENLPPVQENEETAGNQELHSLLDSSLIQEKLYSAEKCLVPIKFVQAISDDKKIQPNVRVLEEVKKIDLIQH